MMWLVTMSHWPSALSQQGPVMSEQALKPVNQTYKIDLFPYPVSDLNKQQLRIPLMNKNMS